MLKLNKIKADTKKVAEHKKELTKLGTIRRRRGLFVFQLHAGNVSRVEMRAENIQLLSPEETKKVLRVDTIPGATYIQALNQRNAIKKFKKLGHIVTKN